MRVRSPQPNTDALTADRLDEDPVGQELDRIADLLDDLEQRLAAWTHTSAAR